MKLKTILLAASLFSAFTVQAEDLDIPVVPLEVAKKDLPKVQYSGPMLDQNAVKAELSKVSEPKINEKSVIEIIPGVNEFIPISIGYGNRIVTPFENPVVNLALKNKSDATITAKQNVIYVLTDKKRPLTFFINEKGDESQAISLTLIPKEIPPRDVTLRMSGSFSSVGNNSKAQKWERSQPYLVTIQSIFSTVAKGGIPPGYTFSGTDGLTLPSCRQAGIEVQFGLQQMTGHDFVLHVGLAENVADRPLEFDEDSCAFWDIKAVASFPRLVLQPGEKTEVYVLQQRGYAQKVTPARPSLVGAP